MAATADTTASLRPIDPGARVVLIEKGQPSIVIDPVQNPRADSKQNALDCSKFNAVIVDVIASGPNTQTTSVTVLGSPFNGEPWIQEWDPNAFQTVLAGTNRRFLVVGVSAWVAIALSAPMNWRVVLTPLDAPAQSTINITGTSNLNIAQIGGVAVSPANPLPVAQTAIVNTDISQVGGVNLFLGQTPSAQSLPVVVAGDQSPLPIHIVDAGGASLSVAGAVSTITGNSPNAPSTGAVVGAPILNLALIKSLHIAAVLQGAVGGVLDLYLQASFDNGTTWVDYAHFPQLLAAATPTTRLITVSRSANSGTAPVPVGSGLVPGLAVNTVVGGDFGQALRLVAVSGAGTTAGALQTINVWKSAV